MTNTVSPYEFSVSEEIARWSLEIYIHQNPQFNWWIAFTNPTAGPWKTISSISTDGKIEEIYRFAREENRPDLVLVNDTREEIIIIEAKDDVGNLLIENQMVKSVTVMNDMTTVLRGLDHSSWVKRRSFRIIPGFLWYSENTETALLENNEVNSFFNLYDQSSLGKTFNVVIMKEDNKLFPSFISDGKMRLGINP